jgi:DNA-binding LacI/PurR family transcriptional regulator
MATDIKDVAQHANVSISTVSRVINKSGYTSEKSRVNVMEAVRKLGYRQNNVARSLRHRRSNFVGLLVPDISNEFYSTLAKVIERELSQVGLFLFLCNTEENEKTENLLIDSMLDNQVSGLIVIGSGDELNTRLLQTSVPTVIYDQTVENLGNNNVVFVKCDNYLGAYLVAETFIKKGARKIAMLQTNHPVVPMREREQGFLDVLRKYRISKRNYEIFSVNISSLEAMLKVKEIFAEKRFDSLFCAADILAIGAFKAFHDLGIAVPDEVQIIGFDDIPAASFLTPALSTIHSDVNLIGRTIASKIVKLHNKQMVEKTTILPVNYIERDSTRK